MILNIEINDLSIKKGAEEFICGWTRAAIYAGLMGNCKFLFDYVGEEKDIKIESKVEEQTDFK